MAMLSPSIYEDPKTCDIARSFLAVTLRQLCSCVKAESGSLFIADPATRELSLSASFVQGGTAAAVAGVRRKIGEGISGKVALLRQPVLVEDIARDRRFRGNGFSHYRTGSFISIPVEIRGQVFALINASDKREELFFSETDFAFAKTLCSYAQTIIENLQASALIRREKELLSQEKSLMEKYAAVGKMASGIVHEISNPLDGVIRFTNMLLNQLEQHSTSREYLLQIQKGLYSIDSIAKSLRSFGFQFNGSVADSRPGCPVEEIIEESLAVFKPRIGKKYRIVKHYCPGLRGPAKDGLRQVFVNIIKNALDAMAAGGTLLIKTERERDRLCVRFKDTGPGIPPEVQGHIFEPFFTTKGADKGAGLGLSICKEIVEGHRGEIRVESSPRRGTQFSILLPFARDE